MDLPSAGHNLPPDMTVTADETMTSLSDWMREHPVIQDEDCAREAKVYIDRGKLCIADLEDERDGKVRPLNEQVKAINDHYRGPREMLRKVLDELEKRISAFLRSEEDKRIKAAEEARARLAEAERVAREAERLEQDRISSAAVGEIDVDVATAVKAANEAFSAYQKAEHQAALAERETRVRIGGGFSKAIGLKDKETLTVTDGFAAVMVMGITPSIEEAILKSARAYRKLHDCLPDGIESSLEREV